jgi:hypothetical protein
MSNRIWRDYRFGDPTMVFAMAGKDASDPNLSADDILFCLDARQGRLVQAALRGFTGDFTRIAQPGGNATYQAVIAHNFGFVPMVHFTWIRDFATIGVLTDAHLVTTTSLIFTITIANQGATWRPSQDIHYEIYRVSMP